jgi:hypothetical protein
MPERTRAATPQDAATCAAIVAGLPGYFTDDVPARSTDTPPRGDRLTAGLRMSGSAAPGLHLCPGDGLSEELDGGRPMSGGHTPWGRA